MKFDIWTFAFQIINFAVLLFVLQRLLYRPVREIMEQRRAAAAKALAEAETARTEAEELKVQHQAELDELNGQRGRLMEEMAADAAAERRKLLDEAGREAKSLMDRERALFDAEKERYGTELRQRAIDATGLFAGNIFREIADAELHGALFRRFLGGVDRIAAELRDVPSREEVLEVDLTSAFPLDGDEERRLHGELEKGTGRPVTIRTAVDPDLLAGVRLKASDLVFDASLAGQVATLAARLKESV
jgi:F-type H+-transporting ATPase subunit b